MEIDNICVKICRLCAEATNPQTCTSLFDENKQERIITKQINQLVTNLISPDDGLPQEICLKCSKNVELCYTFLSDVIATQNKLKRLIYPSEEKVEFDPNKDDFEENSRFENVTVKENDKRINRNSLPKSIPFNKTDRASQENVNITDVVSENNLSKLSTSSSGIVNDYCGAAHNEAHNIRMKISISSTRCEETTNEEGGSQLFLCGVCLKKFSNKNVCLKHILASHPAVKNSFNSAIKLVCPSTNKSSLRSTINETKQSQYSTSSPFKRTQNSFPPVNGNSVGRKNMFAIDSIYNVVRKNCVKYTCDVCGRLMTSWFAFKRHLLLHVDAHRRSNYRKRDEKKFKISTVDKPFVGYCEACNKLVEHFQRHNTYHAIVKLEFDYPDFVKLFSV